MTIGCCRGGTPSLYLSPGGGEIGLGRVFFGGGRAPSLCLSPDGGEIGGRVGEAGELFELLEVLADVV